MNDADQLKRIALLREFKEMLPMMVSEFSVEVLIDAVNEAEAEYSEDQEKWDVMAENNSRSKQKEIKEGYAKEVK